MSTANHLPGSVSGSDETRADTDVYGLHFVRALATPQDIVAIERRGHDAFLPWPHVPAALDSAARVFAERPALRYLRSAEPNEAPVTWTHGELGAQRCRTANLLHSLGVDETHAVAFLLPAIPEAYLTLFGGEAAGLVCPVNYLLNAEHIAELMRATNARVLVALAPCASLDLGEKVALVRAACPDLQHVLWVRADEGDAARAAASVSAASAVSTVSALPTFGSDFNALLAEQRADALTFERAMNRDSLAACFHTGGTTGAPKLARHTHGNQLHAAWSAAHFYGSTEADVVINGFPLFHVAGSFVYGLSTLLSGGCVVLPTLLGMRNTAFVQRYWAFAEKLGATLLAGVPTVISSLLAVPPADASTGTVRAMFTGGSPLPDELAAQFERRYGIPVRNILGMTECAGVVSIEPFLAERVPGSCGLRLPFGEVVAGDTSDGSFQPLPAGETGILALRGPNVGPGYSDDRYNAGTFVEGGWLVTGDIGHVDTAGRIFITGRAKDLIIRSSHNIDPGMIEEALLRHPAVAHAAAVGEPDDYAGEVPVAFVVLRPGSVVDETTLLARTLPHIAERPAWPKRLTIVDTMPMTAIGKVYKPALRALAIARVLRERLHAAGLADRVTVNVLESPKGLRVRFEGSAVDEAQRTAIALLMARTSLAYDIAG